MKKKIKGFFLSELCFSLLGNYSIALLFQLYGNLKNREKIEISFAPTDIIEVFMDNASKFPFFQFIVIVNIAVFCASLYLVFEDHKGSILNTKLVQITDKIFIPVSAGTGQYGRQHFMTLKELDAVDELETYKYTNKNTKPPKSGGIVLGIYAIGKLPEDTAIEKIVYMGKDRHMLLVGATRCGKTRRIIIESIWFTLLAGDNVFVNDPKGELFAYTSEFAVSLGYQVVSIDLRDPNKGNHHNFLQEIISAIKQNEIGEAIDLTWDLVAVLVGESTGEKIWHDGECAAIAAVILIVATEAPEQYQNLTNVYYFLFNMAKPGEYGAMPISRYLEGLPETHPARAVFAMAEIAHTRTRGSFFSSALGTLKYFTNPKIAEMTSSTDVFFEDMVNKKTIVYLILPDEKTTLYGLASMYIMQHYAYMVKAANRNGGRCPLDWWYLIDEFATMPYIPAVPQYVSVGAGRGLRFLLVVQNFQQLDSCYKEANETIKNNCEFWIFLKGSETKTLKEFSTRLGDYTIQVNTTGYSIKGKKDENHSASLAGRNLLKPEEVGLVSEPYSLISKAGDYPLMLISPDLIYYKMNKELGLGDKEHNRKVYIERHKARKERRVDQIALWGIWRDYQPMEEYDGYDGNEEKISFID